MPDLTHDTELAQPKQALRTESPQEWQAVLDVLPPELWEQARAHKAFERARGLRHPSDLLRGILAYVFCLSSFRQVGAWATSIGLSGNGERSWAKRTRQAAPWLLWLLQAQLAPPAPQAALALPASFCGRIHLVDATHLRTWKRGGESRRLHVSYDLLGQRIEQIRLTDHHVGERLGHFQPKPGDITVGDSAYCRRAAIMAHLDARAEVVLRLHWANVPLQQEDGSPFDLSGWLKQLEAGDGEGERPVWIALAGRRVRLRLIAKRLSEAAAKRAHRRRKARARKHGCTNQALTIQVADWLLVLTSLPEEQWSAVLVLELYRARWQIELLFKRIKQLVRLHRLRSNVMESNQAVLAALLVGWALLEQQASSLRCQIEAQRSSQAHACQDASQTPISSWQICATLLQSLRSMLLGQWTWAQIMAKVQELTRVLTCHPQQRVHQESMILEQLTQLLTTLQG